MLWKWICFYLQEHKTLLTGTPLQNNVDELFSLLNFLEPKRFNSSAAFLKDFGDLQTEAQVEKLKEVKKDSNLIGLVVHWHHVTL